MHIKRVHSRRNAMKHESKARAAFHEWLKFTEIRHSDLGELLGVPHKTISNWCAGLQTPGYLDREAIEQLTGIKLLDWLTEEEQEARKSKAERVRKLLHTKARDLNFYERLAVRL